MWSCWCRALSLLCCVWLIGDRRLWGRVRVTTTQARLPKKLSDNTQIQMGDFTSGLRLPHHDSWSPGLPPMVDSYLWKLVQVWPHKKLLQYCMVFWQNYWNTDLKSIQDSVNITQLRKVLLAYFERFWWFLTSCRSVVAAPPAAVVKPHQRVFTVYSP